MTARPRFLPADLFGLDALARRALSQRPHPSGLGLTVPDSVLAVPEPPRQAPGEVGEFTDRLELAEVAASQLEPLGVHPAVHESWEKLAQPDSACVVTGQQPGLAGGPLLHLHKALHAIRLAAELEKTWNRPVVPVFWNHGDDHDLAEGQHVWLRNRYHDPCRLGLSGLGSGRRSFGSIVLEEASHGLAAFESGVRSTLSRGREADRPLDLFLPRAGETLERAFTRVLSRLTGHHGLLVLEASALRPIAGRALAKFVTRDLETPLRTADERLQAAGLTPEFEAEPSETAWLYGEDERGRRPLRSGGDGFRYDGEPGSRTGVELAAAITAHPSRFSGGALLRTLVQDAILPNAATVGGFGELRYWARTQELRNACELAPAVFVPRAHVTLTTPAARRALERAKLDAREVLAQAGAQVPEQPQGDSARATQAAQAIRELGEAVGRGLAELRPSIAEVDRGLSVRSKRTAADVKEHLESLAGRVERAARNRHGKQDRHRRHARSVLRPRDQPQERVLTTLQMTIELGGTDWIDQLTQWIEPFPTEHLLLDLDQDGEANRDHG